MAAHRARNGADGGSRAGGLNLAAGQPVAASHGRLHFMDNLRVALTVLIVCQHASFAYAAANWWYFDDAQQQPLLASFFIVNRSFRMSLFFLIAGYFMPYVLDRKGARAYLKDRFRRLGLPILFFLSFVFPLLMYAYYLNFRPYGPIGFWAYYFEIYWGALGSSPAGWSGPAWPDHQIGHLWFTELLLIYAVIYAAWRAVRHRLNFSWPGPLPFPNFPVGTLIIAGVAAVTYWVRLSYPVYAWDAFLGFVQLSFADWPRDIVCFVLGVLAFRNDWLRRLPTATGYRWLGLGLAGAAVFIACDLTGNSFFSKGGTSLKAIIYPIWETITCFGFCLGLPILFREHFDFRRPFLNHLSAASYGVYVVHLPIVVLLQYAIAGWVLSAVVKFLLVAAVAVPLSFALVMLLRRLPALQRVI